MDRINTIRIKKVYRSLVITFFLVSIMICFYPYNSYSAESDNVPWTEMKILTNYYSDPRPDEVPNILRKVINSKLLKIKKDEESLYPLAYMFARIAQKRPSEIESYEEIFEKASHDQRLFLLIIFRITGGEDVARYLKQKINDDKYSSEKREIEKNLSLLPSKIDVLTMKISKPGDLDMLWSDFFITGNKKAVERIIEVMEWQDIARGRLQDYLTKQSVSDDDKTISILRNEIGYLCDSKNHKVLSNSDLDIELYPLTKSQSSADMQTVKQSLNIDHDILFRAMTKAAAQWSLESNALQHKKVLEICENNIPGKSKKAQLYLRSILMKKYNKLGMHDEAIKGWTEVIGLDPFYVPAHKNLAELFIEKRNINACKKELSFFMLYKIPYYSELEKNINHLNLLLLDSGADKKKCESINSRDVIREIIANDANNKTYSIENYVFIRPAPENLKSDFPIQIKASVNRPDRFSVFQTVWGPDGPIYDKWISMGSNYYFQIGVWIRESNDQMIENWTKANNNLKIEQWSKMLVGNDIKNVKCFETEGNKYLYFSFLLENIDNISDLFSNNKIGSHVEIWVDGKTYSIVKSQIVSKLPDKSGNKVDVTSQYIYYDFNHTDEITSPKDYISH